MRRLSLILLVVSACAPSTEVGEQRQALAVIPPTPVLVGRNADSRLGVSVAGCRFNGFVGGAPGDNSVAITFSLDGGAALWLTLPFVPPLPGVQGEFSVCEGSKTRWQVVSGGSAEAWNHNFTTNQSTFRPTRALARSSREAPGWLAISRLEAVRIDRERINDAGIYEPDTWELRLDGGWGSAMAWTPDDQALAVSDVEAGAIQLFDAVTAAPVQGGFFQGPADAGFGSALLFGDVHPNPGFELIVSVEKERAVVVLGKGNTGLKELLRLRPYGPPGTSTGSAPLPLALEPRSVLRGSVLQAFWVGFPERDSLWRFVGDAGTKFPQLAAVSFGASLGVADDSLIIGAPGYEPSPNGQTGARGAVYVMDFNTDVLPTGSAQPCDVMSSCVTQQCLPGRCIGGVICVPTTVTPLCPALECRAGVCVAPPDAGPPDAGTDAGTPDAGEPDAGEFDAGTPDAGLRDAGVDAGTGKGVQQFSACGCTTDGVASTSVLALIIVALSRSVRARRGRLQLD